LIMSSEKKHFSVIRVLICGAGVIAREHARAAGAQKPALEVQVADPSPAARATFVAEFPAARVWERVEDMLAAGAPETREQELVIVATPPWLHYEQTLAALASKRHVLCEKPLALDAKEADEMFAAARAVKRHLACCSSRLLARPVFTAAAALLATESLGPNLRMSWRHRFAAARSGIEYQPASRWFLDKRKAGGGCLYDWGVYDFTTIHALLQPTEVTVQEAWLSQPRRGAALEPGVCYDVEAQVSATLRYRLADGRTLRLDYERATASFGAEMAVHQVEGEWGALSWDWLDWEGHELRAWHDEAGTLRALKEAHPDRPELSFNARPLAQMTAFLAGETGPLAHGCVHDSAAHFNFDTLRAIYAVAASGQPSTLRRADYL
jgi:predicted dehydrogenase